MTTWKLPDLPGEIESDDAAVFLTGGVSYVELSVPGVGRVTLPAEALTKVGPEQPEPGYYLVIDSYGSQALAERDGEDWHLTGQIGSVPWGAVRDNYLTFTRLVPAPPVTLPWKNHGVEVQQTTTDSGPGDHVHVSTKGASFGFAHLKPSMAREMAYALLTAADEADRRLSDER